MRTTQIGTLLAYLPERVQKELLRALNQESRDGTLMEPCATERIKSILKPYSEDLEANQIDYRWMAYALIAAAAKLVQGKKGQK